MDGYGMKWFPQGIEAICLAILGNAKSKNLGEDVRC